MTEIKSTRKLSRFFYLVKIIRSLNSYLTFELQRIALYRIRYLFCLIETIFFTEKRNIIYLLNGLVL